MNRRLFPLLVLFVGLSAGLVLAKWKWDHPIATALDMEIRGGLTTDEDTSLRVFSFDVQVTPHLSLRERKEIADHIWVIPTPITGKRNDNYLGLGWGSEAIIINLNSSSDFYESTVGDLENDTFITTQYRLHPATSRYLREWFANHPRIMKRLHS